MKQPYVIGYPRSGNNWLCYCLSFFCGHDIGFTHGNDAKFLKDLLNKDLCKVLIIRNYKEALIRHKGSPDFKRLKEDLRNLNCIESKEDRTDYVALLKIYDELPEDKRILVYYEDLIINPGTELKRILKDLDGYDERTYKSFIENIEFHKSTSLTKYGNSVHPPVTMGDPDKLLHYSKVMPSQSKRELDSYLERSFPHLFSTYLLRYKEPSGESNNLLIFFTI